MVEEEEIGLDDLWRVLRRQWWVIAAAFVLIVALAGAYTWWKTPVWEASTLIRIEEERRGAAVAEEFMPLLANGGELETEMRVVSTHPIVSRVVEDLHLVFRVTEPAGAPRERLFLDLDFERSTPEAEYALTRTGEDRWQLEAVEPAGIVESRDLRAGERVEVPGGSFVLASDRQIREGGVERPEAIGIETREFDGVVAFLQEELQVSRPDPEAQLFRVSHEDTDRLLVRNLVNAVAQAFIDQRQAVQKTEARSTVAFLREQTAEIESQLQAAERELQQFREEEQVVALEAEAQSQVERLADLQAERSQLAAERNALRNLIRTIDASAPRDRPDYRKLVAFPTFLQNETIQSLVESLTQAEQERVTLRERWTPSHPGIVALDERIRELEDRLGEIGRNYLQSLNDQIASLDAVLARFGSDLEEVPGKELQFARLERQTELLTELHSVLQQRLKEAQISEAVEDPSVRVVEPATLPRAPVAPKPFRNLALAGFLGLMLGVGLAFVREHMDKTIHSDDDVDQVLGVPVLTRVPHLPVPDKKTPRRKALVTQRDARSLPAESYRTLRTNVTYAHAANGAREMVVTSPGAKDGKSVTASNLAVTFAQQGRKTLLVDADLRKSVLHDIFGVERKPGLSDFLVGRVPFEEVVRTSDVQNLFVVPAGITPPNPSELLGSPLMDYLLQKAREEYEAIVFDSPPALAVTDATVLGGKLDGTLIVVRAERTHRKAAQDVVEQLERVGGRVLGVVVNDAQPNGRYGYRYSYYYEYYGKEEDGKKRWRLPGVGAKGS